MKIKPAAAFFLLVLGSLDFVPCTKADELVQVAPHQGGTLDYTNSDSTPPLLGFLARPNAPGRHPAVVLLHWCSGFTDHDTRAAEMLKSWGYVALALDSLGDANMCERSFGYVAERVDAYAALHYLTAQDFVDPKRIAVMGYSMGGTAVLNAVEQGLFEKMQTVHFRAAVAYYPVCADSSGVMTVPTLILVGDQDDWNPAKACQDMAAHWSDIGITRPQEGGVPVTLVVYPAATHAFDATFPAHTYLGHFIKHDVEAAQDAQVRVQEFLQDTLSEAVNR
jgi:dienelactone hydrolase